MIRAQSSTCRAAIITPAGRGAIATVLVVGEDATRAVSSLFEPAAAKPLGEFPCGRIVFGRWYYREPAETQTGERTMDEELVVCRRTLERIEIHCHGGISAAHAILKTLAAHGCDATTWQTLALELSADRIAGEAAIALADARTDRTAAILLDQYHGALRRTMEKVHGFMETGDLSAARHLLLEMDQFRDVGAHLTTPWRVVLAGSPNVGKSSLINAILGYQRSIVFDQPGTTRDVVTATTVLDGWRVQLADTAGLRQADERIERIGVSRAEAELASADLVVLVFDAREVEDVALVTQRVAELSTLRVPPLIVLNKSDLLPSLKPPITIRSRLSDAMHSDVLCTSAKQGQGIEVLISKIIERIVPFAPPRGSAVPFQPRHSKVIRNLLQLLASASESSETLRSKLCSEITEFLSGKGASNEVASVRLDSETLPAILRSDS